MENESNDVTDYSPIGWCVNAWPAAFHYIFLPFQC